MRLLSSKKSINLYDYRLIVKQERMDKTYQQVWKTCAGLLTASQG